MEELTNKITNEGFMTYNRYSPEKLDQLVLRILDVAALLREISQNAKRAKLDDIPMHDRKAVLWCEQLEQWAVKTKVNVDILLLNLPDES